MAEPTAERGTNIPKNKARSPAGIVIPLRPITKATARTKSSNIAPDKSPAEREEPHSFEEMNPQVTAEMHRMAAERGRMSRAGSAVRKIAAVIKNVNIIAPARASTAERAEYFKDPKDSDPPSRPIDIAALRLSNAFFDESIMTSYN